MAAKNKFMNAMKMPAIADMFSSEADRQRESGDLVTEVPLSELHPFVNHPFEVRDDEDMQKLVDSIKENGVLTNLTVRPRAEGGYEIISGHRRFHAAQLAGLDKIKVQVRDVDDDQAIIDMVDALGMNGQDKPLEKVFHAHLVGEATHTTELGNDAAGNMIRFQNVVSALPQDLNRLHGSLEQLTKQLTNAEEELKQPFLQEQELSDKSARLAELDALLNVGNDAPIIEGEAEELEEEPEDALIQSDDELER